MLAVSEHLTAAIKLQVEQVRQEVFGTISPPFASYDVAMTWLKKTGQEPPCLPPEVHQRLQELHQEILKRIVEWSQLTREAPPWSWRRGSLPYTEPEDLVIHAMPVSPGSPLARLERVSRELANLTGFAHLSIVVYILTDLKPLLPPVRVEFGGATDFPLGISHQWATLTVHTPDVTHVQLRHILGEIRQWWDARGIKALTARDQRLLDLVKHFGGPPIDGKGVVAFWRQVQQAWNEQEERAQFRHKSWKATNNRYDRLQDRLEQIGAREQRPTQVFEHLTALLGEREVNPSSTLTS
jgi:hypothetical protein